jgi:predicted dehydrogenase
MTQFIHELDLMGLVYGPPASVSASMDTVHLPIESEDTFAATVRFASGAIVGCTSATGVGKSGVSFDVIGTEKIFQYRSAESEENKAGGLGRYMTLAQKAMRVAGDRLGSAMGRPSRPKGDGGTHKPFFDAVVKALDLGQPLPVGPQDARAAVELATGIYTSALLGEPVEFPLAPSTPYYRGVTARDYEGRNAPREPQRVAGMAGRQAG